MNGFGRGDDNSGKERGVVTKETAGVTLLLFSVLLLIVATVGRFIFGDIGVAINSFLMGLCGFFLYPLLLLGAYSGIVLVSGKKFISVRWVLRAVLLFASVFLIVHLATSTRFMGSGYGAYLSGCWQAASEKIGDATGGGVLFGLIVYPIRFLLSAVGAYILFSLLIVLSVFLIYKATPLWKGRTSRKDKKPKTERVATEAKREYPVAFAFDDLPESPARTRGSYHEPTPPAYAYQPSDSYRQSPVAPYPPQPAEPQESQEVTGRDILFASDPVSNYRNNLIFNDESAFNRRSRNSTMQPTAEPVAPAPKPAPSAPLDSYKSAYAEQAEQTRESMPRKIVAEKPVQGSGYTLRSDELNYPQVPSYKAPSMPEPTREPPRERLSSIDPRAGRLASEPTTPPTEGPGTSERFLHDESEDRFLRGARLSERFPSEPKAERFPSEPKAERFPSEPSTERDFESLDDSEGSFSSAPNVHDGSAERFGERDGVLRRAPIAPEPEPLLRVPEEQDDIPEAPVKREEYGRETLSVRDDYEAPRFTEEPEEQPDLQSERLDEEPSVGFGSRVPDGLRTHSDADLFDDDEMDEIEMDEEPFVEAPTPAPRYSAPRAPREVATEIPSEPAPAPKKHVYRAYQYPSIQNFRQYNDTVEMPVEEVERNSSIILETLSSFRVDAIYRGAISGPTVTRYDFDIPRNIPVRSVIKRDEEIALHLHARDGVNIYSNSQDGVISIEVPNSVRAMVGMRSVMTEGDFLRTEPEALWFVLGKDINNKPICGNIPKMTHILVAGTTNSGKSVCLNAMLVSLICKYSPEDLRLILIDPKRVEFPIYEGLPHLMINEIISDAQKAVAALNWAIKEMERRYELFGDKARAGFAVRNVDEYNRNRSEDEDKLAKIVIVIDELADLMSVAKKDIEERIQRLTQKARAAGIHLIVATQRPSTDVITGVIKGNLPTRIAFRVIQEVDSRIILDESGAEKLLGNGDMLYKSGGMFNCKRVQGAFLSSEEVQAIVTEIKSKNESYYDSEVVDYINKTDSGSSDIDSGASVDENVSQEYIKALAISVKLGTTSISLIQRKCSVGYNHAGKIIEWMELMSYITPFDGKARARTVLLTKEEFESKYGSLD